MKQINKKNKQTKKERKKEKKKQVMQGWENENRHLQCHYMWTKMTKPILKLRKWSLIYPVHEQGDRLPPLTAKHWQTNVEKVKINW